MILGLSSYSYSWAVGVPGFPPTRPMTEHDLLDRAREFDVKLLQIGDNLPLHTFSAERLQRLANRAVKEQIRLEVGTRRLTPERVAEYGAIARKLEARLIRIIIDDAGYHPSADAVIRVLKECVPLLDGLTLGIENHDRFPVGTIREILETVGSDRLGVCLDTANSLGAGEGIETVVSTLAPLVVNLHLKDFAIARLPHLMGFTVEGQPAGDGMLDVSALLESFSNFPRCETAVLELWPPPEPQLEQTLAKETAWVAQSMAYLKPLFV